MKLTLFSQRRPHPTTRGQRLVFCLGLGVSLCWFRLWKHREKWARWWSGLGCCSACLLSMPILEGRLELWLPHFQSRLLWTHPGGQWMMTPTASSWLWPGPALSSTCTWWNEPGNGRLLSVSLSLHFRYTKRKLFSFSKSNDTGYFICPSMARKST